MRKDGDEKSLIAEGIATGKPAHRFAEILLAGAFMEGLRAA